MFEIFADTRRLRVCKKEKITTTSAGINCLVKFSTDYVGHAIKLVFQINGKRWTVETQYNADGSTIRIPNDCFLPTTSPAWSPLNCELTCALRGEYIVEGGTTVTSRLPTVFTSMGIVEQGYDDAGAMTETAPTPTQVTQLETLVANCLSSAQMYTNMASSSATSASNSASIAASYAHMLSCMTVSAVGTAAGSTPTVTVNTVGNVYNFKFGIPKGETGATGPQGPAGADGRDGVDGADGIQGPQGPMGPAGRDGRDGTDGTNGRDGIDGQDGRDGVDGATGPQGPAGPTGPTGPEGPQGPQGPQGPEGPQGPVKVTYHIVYETEPSGYTNPTIADVENWISDSSTVHIVRWKPNDSTNYFDLTYTYSNQTYYYFCGASAQSRIIFARLRRSGSTAGSWSLSYVTLQKAGDTIFTSSNTFLATYNASDPTQNTPLADIEAANTAGLHVYLRYIGSSFFYICPTFRVSESTFYWYAVKQTDTLMYVALTRTGESAGTWVTSTPTIQLTSGRVQTIVGNETEIAKYPSAKAVADYAEPTSNKSTSIDESSDTKYPTTKAVADYVADKGTFDHYVYCKKTSATVASEFSGATATELETWYSEKKKVAMVVTNTTNSTYPKIYLLTNWYADATYYYFGGMETFTYGVQIKVNKSNLSLTAQTYDLNIDTNYYECRVISTATTSAKAGSTSGMLGTVSLDNVTGCVLDSWWLYGNSHAGALTFNYSSKGAKTLYLNGKITSATNYEIRPGKWPMYFDGTNWHIRTDGGSSFREETFTTTSSTTNNFVMELSTKARNKINIIYQKSDDSAGNNNYFNFRDSNNTNLTSLVTCYFCGTNKINFITLEQVADNVIKYTCISSNNGYSSMANTGALEGKINNIVKVVALANGTSSAIGTSAKFTITYD